MPGISPPASASSGSSLQVVVYDGDLGASRPVTDNPVLWSGFPSTPTNAEEDDIVALPDDSAPPAVDAYAAFDASRLDLVELDPVTGWSDASGNAHDLASSGNPPQMREAGVDPAHVRFDGTNDAVSVSFGATLTQPTTMVVAARLRATPAGSFGVICDGLGTSTQRHALQVVNAGGGSYLWRTNAGANLDSLVAVDTTDWHIFTMVHDGASSKFRVDGVERTGNAGTQSMLGLVLGSRYDLGSSWANCDIHAVQIHDSALTTPEIEAIEDLYAWACGVTL